MTAMASQRRWQTEAKASGAEPKRRSQHATGQNRRPHRPGFRTARPWCGSWLLVAATACSQCSMCQEEDTVATLVATRGQVRRDWDQKRNVWKKAAIGTTFVIGDGVRTDDKAVARLDVEGGAALRLQPQTQVRFVNDASRPGLFEVEAGTVELLGGSSGARAELKIGLARLEKGARVSLERLGNGNYRFNVEVGAATLEANGRKVTAAAGEVLEIEVGGAVIDSRKVEDAEKQADLEPEEPAVDEQLPSGLVDAEIQGGSIRFKESGAKSWSKQAAGKATFAPGTELRLTSRTAAVKLTRGGQTATLSDRGSYVIGDQDYLVRALRGEVELVAASADTPVAVPGGIIVAKTGKVPGRTTLTVQRDRSTDLAPGSGRTAVVSDTTNATLRPGEKATLGKDGKLELVNASPKRVVFYAASGESMFVRDPKPPTQLGLRFGTDCLGDGVVRVYRGRSRVPATYPGNDKAHLLLSPGSYRYQLHCYGSAGVIERAASRGTIQVLRDSGKLSLPKTAPSTFIDTDGRQYTVLYQNILPKIEVSWPRAPKEAKGFTLLHDAPGSSPRSLRSDEPRFSFRSGEIREGTHRFSMTADRGKRSRVSEVSLRFDNAAPKASIIEPANGSFKAGEEVTTRGVALAGWSVSVSGKPVELDEHHRFATTHTVSSSQLGFAVRLVHPIHGVNYYLRRSSP